MVFVEVIEELTLAYIEQRKSEYVLIWSALG